MKTMRAKFRGTKVENLGGGSQEVTMVAVTEKPFDKDGNSEDNTFARWPPSGDLRMSISNPSLMGALKEGQKFYLDFTEAAD